MTGIEDEALTRSLRDLTDRLGPDALVRPLTVQLATVVSAAARLLGAESVAVLLLDEADRVRSVAASGRAAGALAAAQERIAVGPGIDALAGGALVAVADVNAEPRYGPLWQEIGDCGVRAVVSAPICLAGQVMGTLDAVVPDPHEWSGPQQRAAEAVAGIVAQMLGLSAQAGLQNDEDGEGSLP